MRNCWIAAAWVCASALAQDAAYEDYVARIAALQRDGADIAQRDGRDALIQQYRDLIEAHPGYPNNIRLETQIAMLYESDFSDAGQPPDTLAAHEVYQHIVASYDPENPYMKTVRKLAADRAAEFDPALAQQMYEGILTDYPEEDALAVQTQYALGKLAEGQGDPATAEARYGQVISYAPSGARVSDAQAADIAAYQENAAASMLTSAIKGADTPEERLKALKKYLEKHQELERAHADLVQHFARSIEGSAGGSAADGEEDGGVPTVEALLASLKKNKPGADADDTRDRARAREQRARDAGAERPRTARRDATLDAATADAAVSANSVEATAAARPQAPGNGYRRAYYTAAALGAVLLVMGAAAYATRRRTG